MSLNDLSKLTLGPSQKASRAFEKASSFEAGLERVDTNVVSGGAYNVAVQKTPKTNALLEFAGGLNKGIGLYGSATELAQKQSEKNVAEMTDEEFEESYNALIEGSGQEAGFFDKVLGRDKQFQTSMVDRWFRDVAPTEVNELRKGLEGEMQNFKTTVDFDNYVEKNVDDYFAAKSVQFADGTHANTAYAVRAAGMAAKLKVTLDQNYSAAADKAIEENQVIVSKQLFEGMAFASREADENNKDITNRFNAVTAALDGDKTRAKAVMKSAVSGIITDLINKGTSVDLEEAQEIYDAFFNSELNIDGKTDVFDDPKMEQSLLSGIQAAERVALEDENKAAERAAVNVVASLYRASQDGSLKEKRQEIEKKANEQLDAGEISAREYAAIMEQSKSFDDKDTAAFNAKRNETEINVDKISADSPVRDETLFNAVLGAENGEDLINLGYATFNEATNKVELNNKYIALLNGYQKSFLKVVNSSANAIDWLKLDSGQQAKERQRLLEDGLDAGKAFIGRQTVKKEETKTIDRQIEAAAEYAINQFKIDPQDIEHLRFKYATDKEALLTAIQDLKQKDVSPLLDESGNLEKKYEVGNSFFPNTFSLQSDIQEQYEAGNVNDLQIENVSQIALKNRQDYFPNSPMPARKVQANVIKLLRVSGITEQEIINETLNQRGKPPEKDRATKSETLLGKLDTSPDFFGASFLQTKREKEAVNVMQDLRGLREHHWNDTGEFLNIGYDIPILLGGSMQKTLDALKSGDVAAFDAIAEALGAETNAQILYNKSVLYHQTVTKLIPDTFDHRNINKTTPSPVEETE